MEEAGSFTTDRDLVIITWDPWISEITGISPDAAIGKPLFDLFPDIVTRGLAPRLTHVVENEAVEILSPAFHHYFLPCPPRAATPNFVRMQQHVTISPLRSGANVTGSMITIEDVTARLDREREIAQGLRSADEATRLHAAQKLATETAAASTLVEAFGDSSWKVRSAAVAGFSQRSGEEITAALTMALQEQHRDLSVVNSALSAIAISGKDVMPRLVEYLRDRDTDLRIYVALALGNLGDQRAVPALSDALDDVDMNVRFHAIEALGRLGARQATPRLAAIAATGDFFLGFAALEAIALIAEASAGPLLFPLLCDETLAEPALQTIGRISGIEAIPTIGQALESGTVQAGVCAVALASIHDRTLGNAANSALVAGAASAAIGNAGEQRLIEAARQAGTAERGALLRVLSWMHNADVDAELIKALSDPIHRGMMIEALVARGTAVVPALLEALRSEVANERARRAMIVVLGRIGSRDAVPSLIASLRGSDEDAVVAAHGLGGLGDARALDPLIDLLDHSNPAVRHAAVAALNSMGHPDLHVRTAPLLQSVSPRVREAAVRIAGYFGYADCADAVIALCSDENAEVRRAAIEHIVYFSDSRVAGILRTALQDPAADVRAAAARGVGRLETDEAADLLNEALGSADPWIRYHAARSADSLASARALLPLCNQAAADPHPPARIAAIDALGHIGDPVTTRVLEAQVDDASVEIAVAAIDALGRNGDPGSRGTLIAALRSGTPAMIAAAMTAIERCGIGLQAADDIAWVAGRAEPELASSAVALLGRMGADVDTIIRVSSRNVLHAVCVEALSRTFELHPDAIGAALTNSDPCVRALAVEALGSCSHREAARQAAQLLDDPDQLVRANAALALQRLDLRAVGAAHV